MITISVREEGTILAAMERVMNSYEGWYHNSYWDRSAISLIKSRAKNRGIKLVINQRYNKQWFFRAIMFKTEAEYTMFMLQWM